MADGPGAPTIAREIDLLRTEQEISASEAQIQAEVRRLESAAGEILARLQQVRAAASQFQLAGLREANFTALCDRIANLGLPRLDLQGLQTRSHAVRVEAINARIRCAEEMRNAVVSFAADLSRVASQVAADESALATYEKLLRDELARQKVEQEETARQRAAREELAKQQAAAAELARQKGGQAPALPPNGFRMVPPEPQPVQAPRASGYSEPLANKPNGRREVNRVRLQAAIDFKSDTNFFTGFSANISEGGIFVATVDMIPRGTPVDLRFSLPGGAQLEVAGVVCWVREVNDKTPEIFPGLGIRFTQLSPEAATAIQLFVSRREPLFFPE